MTLLATLLTAQWQTLNRSTLWRSPNANAYQENGEKAVSHHCRCGNLYLPHRSCRLRQYNLLPGHRPGWKYVLGKLRKFCWKFLLDVSPERRRVHRHNRLRRKCFLPQPGTRQLIKKVQLERNFRLRSSCPLMVHHA